MRGYILAVAVVVVCTLVSMAIEGILETTAFLMMFPLGILVVTTQFGIGPAVVAAAVGVLAFDYVFVPPALAFALPNLESGLNLVVMVAVTAVASVLAARLRRQAEDARRQAEVERLRNALLSALSHDLRTPLTALVGASAALCDERLESNERRQFSRMVADEAQRLNRLVVNLLELTRLESGRVRPKQVLQAIDEVIGSALCRLERQLEGRRVHTDVPQEIPLVAFDPVLIEQVIINLVENVLRHAGNESPIDVAVRLEKGDVLIEISDRGPGVPPGAEERVFDKLYRVPAPGRGDGGVGLGLTICRAIVAAHDGRIWLANRSGGGAVVRFTLPVSLSCTPVTIAEVPS